jgi:hypothetical protein
MSDDIPNLPARQAREASVIYPDEVWAELLLQLMNGLTLREACKIEGMPTEAMVRKRAVEDPSGFGAHYTRSREIGYLGMADEILEIADNGSNDWMKRNDPENEGYAYNGEHVMRSRVRIDTRKWLLAKALPKIFGDKVDHQHSVERVERIEMTFVEKRLP